jgi:phage I-like protein
VEFTVLLDAPAEAESTIQIAKLGDFKDARYGEFSITADEVSKWKQNLDLLPGKEALIDFDHLSDKPSPHRRTEAAGWIKDVFLDGDAAMAKVEWSTAGEAAIREKRFKFFSPSYGKHRDEGGREFDDVLSGGALSNKPFLNMATVQLASDDRIKEALFDDPAAALFQLALDGALGDDVKTLASTDKAMRKKAVKDGNALPDESYPIPDLAHLKSAIILAESGHGDVAAAKKLIVRRAQELGATELLPAGWGGSDSRRTMELNADILAAFGITDGDAQKKILDLAGDEKTEEKTLVDAIEAAKPKPEPAKPEPTKTLEQLAADDGKTVLDQEDVRKLKLDAASGRKALEQLDEERFTSGFNKALDKGKAVAAQKENYEAFYALDKEGTLKMLEDAPVIVNTKPRGKNLTTEDLDVPDGVHPASYQLDLDVRKYMAEKEWGEDKYLEALDIVSTGARA